MDSPHVDPAQLCFESVRTRRSIIASYWLVVALAIPLWWKTTSIERLALPAARVQAASKREVLFPVTVNLEARYEVDTASVAHTVQSWLNAGRERTLASAVDISVTAGDPSTAAYHVVLDPDNRAPAVEQRKLYFGMRPEDAHDESAQRLAHTLTELIVPHTSSSSNTQRVMPYSPRYRLAFTLLNEDAASGSAAMSWNVQGALRNRITPLLDRLSVLHNFTIESQVQFHAPLAFEPRRVEHDGQQAFGLTQEDLTVFVNSAEWTLSSSASNDPVIHFVLFIPSSKHIPLHILDHSDSVLSSNAFLLPQWGGIILLNPSHPPSSTLNPLPLLSQTDLDPVFDTFAYQLLTLLGVPGLPSSVEMIPAAEGAPREPFTEWELDALLRRRAVGNVQGSTETLQSIVRLVDQIEGMPVGPDVKDDIQDALAALNEVHETFRSSPIAALKSSARALTLSSRAFFNPGMLALLYFPAEHKYAVYTPLFASIAAPLLGAVLREIAAWRRARKAGHQQAPQ
ncbi:phosphatidylinositol-glycan biosynthesis class S protein [Earliella scabrosa]|nr:phosphatidylinositol-glycan biosynthesis class S protein [Earliella scabrosa]